MRRVAVILHRYVGLFLAGFLILMGLTGSVIAFHHELDRWLNPGVLTVEPGEGPGTSAVDWIETVEAAHPEARVSYITVPRAADEPAVVYLAPRPDPETGETHELANDQVFVHRGTGEIVGERLRGGFRPDRLHLIPFIYYLHFNLQLGGWGMWFLGIVAIIWLFDCFVGLYLAWPGRAWAAIKRALSVKWRASAPRVNYDLHRAGGLWVWVVLIVLAFSGMSMNLHEEVFDPLLHAISEPTPWPGEVEPTREDPAAPMPMPAGEAIAEAEAALAERGVEAQLGGISINHAKGLYHLGYHTPDDIMHEHPGAWVSVAGGDRGVIDVRPPGGHTAGDMIHDWQFPLHSGKAFGLAGRIAISITGLVVAMLSATGVYIWWKKRRGRRARRRRPGREETREADATAAEHEAESAPEPEPVGAS